MASELTVLAPRPASETGLVRQVSCPPERLQARALGSMKGVDADLLTVLPSDAPIFQLPVRSTAIRDLNGCRRRFFFRYRLGLAPVHEYKAAFKRGEWFHRAVALALNAGHPQADDAVPPEEYKSSTMNHLDFEFHNWLHDAADHAKDNIMPDGTPRDKFCETATADFYKARAMAMHFLGKWGPLPQGFEPLTVEKMIFCKAKGIGRTLVGRLDILARETSTGYLWIIDHKTTSKPPIDLTGALDFDLQPQHYRLLAMAAFPNDQIAGVIHNIVMTPTIRYSPRGLDKAGPGSFDKRLTKWYDERMVEGSHDPKKLPSLRSTVRFTGDGPSEDYMTLLRNTSRLAAGFLRLSRYPRCSDNYTCLGGTAGSACPFLRLCRHERPYEWKSYFPLNRMLFQQQDLLHKDPENARRP